MKRLEKHKTRKKKQLAVWLSWFCLALMMIVLAAVWIKLDRVMTQNTDLLNQIMSYRTELQQPEPEQKVSLGTFDITHYCACAQCCGKTDRITYAGTIATPNRTIAVDPDEIALGEVVIIDNQEYVAEDVGGAVKGKHIDIFVKNHQEALSLGRVTKEVFVGNKKAASFERTAAFGKRDLVKDHTNYNS